MGTWYEMTKYNIGHNSKNHLQKFLATWSYGEIFWRTNIDIKWQPVSHKDFLPWELANRYKSFRGWPHATHEPQVQDLLDDLQKLEEHREHAFF